MNTTPFLPLPEDLCIDKVELRDQMLLVHLHSTSCRASCPKCGADGSRIHSRYHRTVSDVACGGQRVILKMLIRKWVCSEAVCPQSIFAEQFPELVPLYARMTHRLLQALHLVGVTTNGTDGARLLSALAMPVSGKTIISRTLQLPLPEERLVRVAGVDEWAWKKGSYYGTVIVDLEKHQVAALLPDRSVETASA